MTPRPINSCSNACLNSAAHTWVPCHSYACIYSQYQCMTDTNDQIFKLAPWPHFVSGSVSLSVARAIDSSASERYRVVGLIGVKAKQVHSWSKNHECTPKNWPDEVKSSQYH